MPKLSTEQLRLKREKKRIKRQKVKKWRKKQFGTVFAVYTPASKPTTIKLPTARRLSFCRRFLKYALFIKKGEARLADN